VIAATVAIAKAILIKPFLTENIFDPACSHCSLAAKTAR
jgi:hypothetical protein